MSAVAPTAIKADANASSKIWRAES